MTFINIDDRVHRVSAPHVRVDGAAAARRAHAAGAAQLPGFESQDLYPLNFNSLKPHPHKFTYSLANTPVRRARLPVYLPARAPRPAKPTHARTHARTQVGTYFYGDTYNKLGGKLVVETWPPWEKHPGYPGARGRGRGARRRARALTARAAGGANGGGPTRIVGARARRMRRRRGAAHRTRA